MVKKEKKLPYGLFTALAVVIVLACVLVYALTSKEGFDFGKIKADDTPSNVKETEAEFKPDPKIETGNQNEGDDNTENKGKNEDEKNQVTPPLEIPSVPAGYTVYLGFDVLGEVDPDSDNPFADENVEKQLKEFFKTYDGVEGVQNANLIVVYSGEKFSSIWDTIVKVVSGTEYALFFSREGRCIRVKAAGFDSQVANILSTEGIAAIYRENRTDAQECLILTVKPVRRELYSDDWE